MDENNILNFFAEAGKLKSVKRSGWWMVGASNAESVADHSFRCAVIGYVLAKLEKADISKVLLMTLFNDLHEARITDLHKVAHKYLDVRSAEKKAFIEQTETQSQEIKEELREMRREYDSQQTNESIIARDADILECLLQAKEYTDAGLIQAEKFQKKAPECLRTKSAQALWKKALVWDSSQWWEKLEHFER